MLAPVSNTYITQPTIPVKVLLLDQDREYYTKLYHILTQNHQALFKLDWISSYPAGLETIAQGRHDFYLINCWLDTPLGFGFFRRVAGTGCRAPVVALLKADDLDLGRQAVAHGATDYWLKSQLDPQLLPSTIERMIEHKQCSITSVKPTTLKESEQRSLRHSLELHQLKRKLAEETAKRQQLERTVEKLDLFAQTIDLLLDEPLKLITDYTDLLKNKAALPDYLQAYLTAVGRSSEKIGTIVDQMQRLSDLHQAEIEKEPLNVVRIVSEVQQRLAHLIEVYQAQIHFPSYWPEVIGDRPLVEEIWANCLSLAIKSAGICARVQVGATAQSNDMVRFWVRYNGPAPTPSKPVPALSDPTQPASKPTESELRVALLQTIVDKSGGKLIVKKSELSDQETIISFTLPQGQIEDSLECNNQVVAQ